MPPEVLGPYGLVAAALIAIGVLWRAHQESDADVRRERDVALAIGQAQVEATNRVADELAAERREREKLQANLVRLAERAKRP